MSDTVILGIVTGIPTILIALGTFIISLRNSKKTDVVEKKVDEVHTLTNSNLSTVTKALETANTKIEVLTNLIAELNTPKKKIK